MNIIDSLRDKIQGEIDSTSEFKKSLIGKKVVISIIEGVKVLVKVITIAPKKERQAPILKPEERRSIKIIKKSVKINTDVSYLLTLIDDVKNSISKLDFKHITEEAAQEIGDKMNSLDILLGKTILRIEHLPPTKDKDTK